MKLLAYVVLIVLFAGAATPAGAGKAKAHKTNSPAPGLAQLQQMRARFAPTALRVDTSKLSSGDSQALVKLIEAGRIMDDIFMNQYWSGDGGALLSGCRRTRRRWANARLQYFGSIKAPVVLDNFKALLPGVPAEKPREPIFILRT